jgi:hypothetical protein
MGNYIWVMLITIQFRTFLSSCLRSKSIKVKRIIIFPLGLYGLSHYGKNTDWGVSENRVLRKIFGPENDKVIGGRRKLHNEELQNL